MQAILSVKPDVLPKAEAYLRQKALDAKPPEYHPFTSGMDTFESPDPEEFEKATGQKWSDDRWGKYQVLARTTPRPSRW